MNIFQPSRLFQPPRLAKFILVFHPPSLFPLPRLATRFEGLEKRTEQQIDDLLLRFATDLDCKLKLEF